MREIQPKQIWNYLRAQKWVQAAYIAGHQVGVVINSVPGDLIVEKAKLKEGLAWMFDDPSLEVIILNDLEPARAYKVTGQLLYARDDMARLKFEYNLVTTYLDTEFMRGTERSGPMDINRIKEQLARLRTYTKSVRAIQREGRVKVLKSDLLYSALERRFELACAVVLDIGNHIIVLKGLKRPTNYADIITVLSEGKILNKKVAAKAALIAGARDMLVHDLAGEDRTKIFDSARDLMPVIEEVGNGYQKLIQTC